MRNTYASISQRGRARLYEEEAAVAAAVAAPLRSEKTFEINVRRNDFACRVNNVQVYIIQKGGVPAV